MKIHLTPSKRKANIQVKRKLNSPRVQPALPQGRIVGNIPVITISKIWAEIFVVMVCRQGNTLRSTHRTGKDSIMREPRSYIYSLGE
ncbi:hypothetical protein CEXT_162051 [Caerostris extrusa]|uniref:Uncharacterized protein n=1 Tax=Caerostris extrusa TaxID=172846 RepID=A0AAV4NQL7_CAEEX|nr:hypothetical protein CEXT_162051 [Caerostris extrusa]